MIFFPALDGYPTMHVANVQYLLDNVLVIAVLYVGYPMAKMMWRQTAWITSSPAGPTG